MQYEKDIEDYICNHQEYFINELKRFYGEDTNIEFVGRQVHLGEEHIIDLLYKFDSSEGTPEDFKKSKSFIVVELKNRTLEAKDFAQIVRYMSVLEDKIQSLDNDYNVEVYGILFAPSISQDANILIHKEFISDKIEVMMFETSLSFGFCNRSEIGYSDGYIKNLALDKRLYDEIKEKNDGQPAETK